MSHKFAVGEKVYTPVFNGRLHGTVRQQYCLAKEEGMGYCYLVHVPEHDCCYIYREAELHPNQITADSVRWLPAARGVEILWSDGHKQIVEPLQPPKLRVGGTCNGGENIKALYHAGWAAGSSETYVTVVWDDGLQERINLADNILDDLMGRFDGYDTCTGRVAL